MKVEGDVALGGWLRCDVAGGRMKKDKNIRSR